MSLQAQYWTRVGIVGLASVVLNLILDRLLGVPYGSGRDWLLFFAILLMGNYLFVIRWANKSGYKGGA